MSTILAIDLWQPIPRRPAYEVSITGRVRRGSRELKPWQHKSGHLYVGLGRGHRAQVHHLVASAFGAPKTDEAHECRHLDGCPTNNRASNLRWGTRKENVDDLKATSGRYAKASLSDGVASEIKRLFSGKHGEQTRLAKRFGVSLSVVNRILKGKTYAHLGG